jgi:hypothetical protein
LFFSLAPPEFKGSIFRLLAMGERKPGIVAMIAAVFPPVFDSELI